jgi:hypothetical protein
MERIEIVSKLYKVRREKSELDKTKVCLKDYERKYPGTIARLKRKSGY